MAIVKLKRAATAGASLSYGEMAIGGDELYFGNSSNLPVKMSKDGHTHTIANISGLQASLNEKANTNYVDAKTFLKSNTDDRTVLTIPNDYNSKFEIKGLKTNSVIGITGGGTYSAVLGIRGWSESSGGDAHELAFDSSGRINHRSGSTTTWNSWKTLIESDDSRLSDARTPTAHNQAYTTINNVPAGRILGRNTSETGAAEAITYANLKSYLSLNNVTNESKTTMFTSPTFTGIAAASAMNINGAVGIRATALTSAATQILVVSGSPSGVTQTIRTRTPAQLLSDIGAMSTSHAANAITSTNISNWNEAYGWDNHASAGYIKAHPPITMETNTTTTSSPGYAGTFTAIDSITKDSNGHVTKINTKTVTMPSAQSIPSIPSVMETTEGNTGTATTQRTINAKNLKAIILNHSPAGPRTPTTHEHMSIEVKVGQDSGASKLSVFQDIDGTGYTTKTGLALFRQYGSSQPMLEISELYGSTSSIEFATNEGNAFNFNKPVKVNDTNVSLAGHKHTKSEITDFAHTHTKSQITDFAHNHNDLYYTETEVNNLLAAKAEPWKLIRSAQASIPTSLTANNITVVSGNYYNKILAFEVRVVTATDSFETHIVFARMGSNTEVTTSATYDRFYSWTAFDGRYLKTHSFKAYCSNAASTTITVGAMKHLVGSFLNNTIEWTTPTITTYIERIWLVN